MEEYLSKLMTYAEVESLLKHIQAEHQVGAQGKWIKYVEPTFDMRFGLCYKVSFIGWSPSHDVVIHTQNECATLKDSLYKRCHEGVCNSATLLVDFVGTAEIDSLQ